MIHTSHPFLLLKEQACNFLYSYIAEIAVDIPFHLLYGIQNCIRGVGSSGHPVAEFLCRECEEIVSQNFQVFYFSFFHTHIQFHNSPCKFGGFAERICRGCPKVPAFKRVFFLPQFLNLPKVLFCKTVRSYSGVSAADILLQVVPESLCVCDFFHTCREAVGKMLLYVCDPAAV